MWNFGDGSTSDVANPLHSYESSGTGGDAPDYFVTHTVYIYDIEGNLVGMNTCSQWVHVEEEGIPGGCPLCPDFASEVGPIIEYHVNGCSVDFTAHVPPGYDVVWFFGDGMSGNGLSTTHPYNPLTGEQVYRVTVSMIHTINPSEVFRCERTIKVDCSRPCCDFTWSLADGCCFGLNLDVQSCNLPANTTYAWYVDGKLVSMDKQPANLFPHGINICDIQQQQGGIIEVSLVTQLNGESCLVTKNVDLNSVEPGIYIGYGDLFTNKLSDYSDLLPGNSYCGTCPVYVCGLVDVDKDFEFCGAEVVVNRGFCGFSVKENITFTISNGTHMHGCECLWFGNIAEPLATINVTGGSTIEDAAFGVWTQSNFTFGQVPNLGLNAAIFKNNFIGVWVSGDLNLTEFTRNLFTTDRTLFPDCEDILHNQNYVTNIGLAGIKVDHNNGGTLHLPDDGNHNMFNNLALGIISSGTIIDGGTLTLDPCCTFKDINTCTFYQAYSGGTGVHFTNIGSFTSNSNIFDNVGTGIKGTAPRATNISITNNNMLSVARGIDLYTKAPAGSMTGGVSNNNITVNRTPCITTPPGFAYGIGFEDNTNQVNDVTITANPITATYAAVPGFSVYGIYLNQESTANNAQVQVEVVGNNAINMNNGFAGIHVRKFIRAAVYNNTVNWTGTGSFGILVDAGRNNFICSNNINGGGAGLRIVGSQTATIQNNTMTNTGIGAFFSGNCGFDTNFGCNTFAGTQSTGLFYDAFAQVGIQTDWEINAGNEWTGNFTVARAHINLLSSIPGNLFFVPQGHPTLDPGNTQAFGGQRWFVAEDWIAPGNCEVNACMGFGRPAEKRSEAVENEVLSQIPSDFALQIAPNPNTGDFIVTFDKNPDDAAELQVISVSGALVKSYEVRPGDSTYRISGMAPGIYFVKMTSNGKTSAPVKMVVF